MKRPTEPQYKATGELAKQIVKDLRTPATQLELEVMRRAFASRKNKKKSD